VARQSFFPSSDFFRVQIYNYLPVFSPFFFAPLHFT